MDPTADVLDEEHHAANDHHEHECARLVHP
jgi:hypothetical protein